MHFAVRLISLLGLFHCYALISLFGTHMEIYV